MRYLAVVPDGTPPVCSEESEQVAWWPVDAPPRGHGDVADLVRVALRTLRGPACVIRVISVSHAANEAWCRARHAVLGSRLVGALV